MSIFLLIRSCALFPQNSIIPLDLGLSHQQLLDWTFVVDALNFNFWTPDGQPKFTVKQGSKVETPDIF